MELVRAAQEAVVHERTHRADEAVDTLLHVERWISQQRCLKEVVADVPLY